MRPQPWSDGIVLGFAVCGEPLADEFLYDRAFGEFTTAPPTTTIPASRPTNTPPPTPIAPAADAVTGRPTYAG